MLRRTDRYDIGLDEIDAHTFKIMEIIEEEKSSMELKKHREMKRMIE